MKEIGGYFELELQSKKEYHKKALKLNSGRNCFKYILETQKVTKIYIPNYICDSLIEPLKELKINYEFYNINKYFEIPENIILKKNEKLIYVNYFSLKSKYINELALKYDKKLIIDNTQAFFEMPVKNIDTIYSPRKFFGVSDGGYLYTNHLIKHKLKDDESYQNSIQLIGRVDKNASIFYEDYQKSELRLSNQAIKNMSKFTFKVLNSIDYKSTKMQRERNFYFLHSELKSFNNLNIDIKSITTPFTYPFLTDNSQLQSILIKNNIYVAHYWKEVLTRKGVSQVEKTFVDKIIPLPIDQRYHINDMCRIVETIKSSL